MADFRPSNVRYLTWDNKKKIVELMEQGWQVLSHGSDGVNLKRPPSANTPAIFGGRPCNLVRSMK